PMHHAVTADPRHQRRRTVDGSFGAPTVVVATLPAERDHPSVGQRDGAYIGLVTQCLADRTYPLDAPITAHLDRECVGSEATGAAAALTHVRVADQQHATVVRQHDIVELVVLFGIREPAAQAKAVDPRAVEL